MQVVAKNTVKIIENSNFQMDQASSYQLFQSEPNPVKDKTKLKFYLPENTRVRLILIDSEGNVIDLIKSGALRKGMHIIDYSTAKINEGLYYYRLETLGYSETKPMRVIK